MLLQPALSLIMTLGQALLQRFEIQVKAWTGPASVSLIGGTAADLLKSRAELIAENAFLRQQIILHKRQTKPPKLTPWDRGLLARGCVAGRARCCW